MAICYITLGIAILIFIGSAFGFKFGSVKVGSLVGGLGAVVLILSLFGVGC